MVYKSSKIGLDFNGNILNKGSIKIGDKIEWMNVPYSVLSIERNGVRVRNDENEFFVPYNEISLVKELKDDGNPILIQVGGNHYKDFAIQPVEFTFKNNLNFLQGNVIKYICRYKNAKGKEDLEKAKHYIDLLIQFEYGEK